jgi:hypothetical protein
MNFNKDLLEEDDENNLNIDIIDTKMDNSIQ